MNKRITIKVYHGFGHTHDLTVFGHVFRSPVPALKKESTGALVNLFQLLRLFFVKPLPGIPLTVIWDGQEMEAHTESDGFFRIEWTAKEETTAGWHEIEVRGRKDGIAAGVIGKGKIFIPHRTQYGFISDIDDTIMVSHSATIGRRLKELLFRSPHSRQVFPDVSEHYRLLAMSHTEPEAPNPFFYVSSSEWNLYDYLRAVFTYRKMPNGAFLLNQVKRWYELWKTGKTTHEGKLLRILRILKIFPNQHFILFGDNSQADPDIYSRLADKYADRIFAVYIRNVRPEVESRTRDFLKTLENKGVHTLLFADSQEAIEHSKKIGLIAT